MTSNLPPDVRHRNLERLVVEIVQGAIRHRGKRLLLIIEDVQWMNVSSMKLLLKVKWSSKVMIIDRGIEVVAWMRKHR